jgi:hypothetical protein
VAEDLKEGLLGTTRSQPEIDLDGSDKPSDSNPDLESSPSPSPGQAPSRATLTPIEARPALPPTGPPRGGLKLSAGQVVYRFGISSHTFERWLLNQELRFPRPIYILRRRYWELTEIENWERHQAAASAGKTA